MLVIGVRQRRIEMTNGFAYGTPGTFAVVVVRALGDVAGFFGLRGKGVAHQKAVVNTHTRSVTLLVYSFRFPPSGCDWDLHPRDLGSGIWGQIFTCESSIKDML